MIEQNQRIPFNKPWFSGNETSYIEKAVRSGKISGNGQFTHSCQEVFQNRYGFKKCLLTSSCTDALEMAAILSNISIGDEVIIPSYTYVSTANAFVLRGAKIVFADSRPDHPGIDENNIENLITQRTKAIVVVHYAGIACDMVKVMAIAEKCNIIVIEDAAHSVNSYYNDQALGGIGHIGCFSFHETKNIQCGEGGMLVINDERLINRAEVIWEKGTDRVAFSRGEISKYSWIDIGSSFLPSEISAAFLFAQLENIEKIHNKRKELWDLYYEMLFPLTIKGLLKIPTIPEYSTNPYHLFYILLPGLNELKRYQEELLNNNVLAVTHYLSLHKSPYSRQNGFNFDADLTNADRYQDTLLRLPLYFDLKQSEISHIVNVISNTSQESYKA